MMDASAMTATRCPTCFAELSSAQSCPRCTAHAQPRSGGLTLATGTVLVGQYRIGQVLGQPGGFGITYLAWDEKLETRVAIKEFFPRELAGRSSDRLTLEPHTDSDESLFAYGLQQFLSEARTLARFDHPNIVRVRTFFEANGTGYLVMDYYEGQSLSAFLARQPGGRIAEGLAVEILMPVLDGLRAVHAKGVLHRDIDPHNLYLTAEGRVILLDFGAARTAMGEKSRSLSVILKPGYAPYEQYATSGRQGPWTDVYACAATLYRMVTGVVPVEAPNRVLSDTLRAAHELNPEVSPQLSAVLQRALALRPEQRPQSVAEFQQQLLALRGEPPQPPKEPPQEVPTRPSPRQQEPAPQKSTEAGVAAGAKSQAELQRRKQEVEPAGKPTGVMPEAEARRGTQVAVSAAVILFVAVAAAIILSEATREGPSSAPSTVASTTPQPTTPAPFLPPQPSLAERELEASVAMLSPALLSRLERNGYRPVRRLLHEDFSSNRNGWWEEDEPGAGYFAIRNGRAYIMTRERLTWYYRQVPVPHRDVAIRFDLRYESGEDSDFYGAGLVLRNATGKPHVLLTIAAGVPDYWSAEFYLVEVVDPQSNRRSTPDGLDRTSSIGGGTETDALIPRAQNTVELIAIGGNLQLFINGRFVEAISGIPETRGEWLGLQIMKSGLQYSFDNLVVVEIERQ